MRRLLTLGLVALLLVPGGVGAQEGEDDVARLMADMSPAARVGQLFLVTFPGAEVGDDSLIAELIRDYAIGGVVLLPENGNIVNEGDTPEQVATLAGQLQDAAWSATRPVTRTVAGAADTFVPLFIAVNHEGNGMRYTGIVNGTTPLPSQMALGATWKPAHAGAVGEIAGRELHAVGVNMLLGPSLDVLETPRPASSGDLGVRAFGGEPFWVGQMGQAYISGVHLGSGGGVAVIAKHFPGLGAADRSLDEEVSTVQRTLEKLKQVDLLPFASAAQAEDPLARPDGMLVSHIRFQGLEGGRFARTRPISVDSQVLQQLLGLSELSAWRAEGGVTVSDGLGLRALQRFYDASGQTFNSRRIAQEAFKAGNDLLYLAQFASTDDWEEQAANVRSTISFFRANYENDPSFQALVDAAVARILRLKLSLYGGRFDLSAARPDVDGVAGRMGSAGQALAAIARDAVTLLSPPSPDLVPVPPTSRENVVIFTDDQTGSPCSVCASVPYLSPSVLEETMVRLYGPTGTGQITPWRVTSFTFTQLGEYLDELAALAAPTPTPGEGVEATPIPSHPVGPALAGANWVLLATLKPAAAPVQSGVVRRFLAGYADELEGTRLVVLAFDAPYYLDATEISKLSAYYVAYSRTGPFAEHAVRAMFGEFAPAGMPPVSVAGVNYDIVVRTSPDPGQVIPLTYMVKDLPGEEEPTANPTMEMTATPTENGPAGQEPGFEAGDQVALRTGVIVDRNRNPVPDGTPVQFFLTYPQENLERSTTATTVRGVAETVMTLDRDRTGQLEVSIQADPVPRAVALRVTVRAGTVGGVETLTPGPTAAPTTEPGPSETEAPPVTPVPTPEAGNGAEGAGMDEIGSLDLALALAGAVLVGGVGYFVVRSGGAQAGRALRLALWCIVGGLTLYLAYALRFPGVDLLRARVGPWGAAWVALLGGLAPLLVARVLAWLGMGEPEELRWGERLDLDAGDEYGEDEHRAGQQ